MITLDLQLFSGEKTEKATPKKREDARNKGQVAKSQEFGQAIILLTGLIVLKVMAIPYLSSLLNLFRNELSFSSDLELNDQTIFPLLLGLSWTVAKLVLPMMGTVFVIAALVTYLQVGSLFTIKPLIPDLKKINPIEGFKRMFSMRSLVELLKSLFKMMVVGFIVYLELSADWKRVSQLGSMEVLDIVKVVGTLAYAIFWKVAVAILVLAIFDLWYQRFEFEKGLKMSKQDIKDEHKQSEGSPEVKGKIKERQRAMAMRRMMADVPQADVIITNPTHFAIALKYAPDEMESPKVVAKGVDEIAQKIKQVAKEADVVMVENRPLAQTLYKTVEIGEYVPGELFQAVAEVLAYVYRLKGKG